MAKMMIVDSSVLVAIHLGEEGAEALMAALTAEPFALPAPALTEASLRLVRKGLSPEDCDRFFGAILVLGGDVAPFTQEMASAATVAYARFGKGTGHKADLNLGDALVYGAARTLGLPLFFKGNDFRHTDLTLHPASVDGNGGRIGSVDS
ncbi:MAG: type II toxin-antitoxin system VapC family toxin [Pseudomonadota bacterium]